MLLHISNIAVAGDVFALFNVDVSGATKIHKIAQGAKMNVGRVIPLVGQALGDGHAALKKKLRPELPIGKVREANQSFVSNTQHLVNGLVGFVERLECLGQDRKVKAL
jgi:hypothetical protein